MLGRNCWTCLSFSVVIEIWNNDQESGCQGNAIQLNSFANFGLESSVWTVLAFIIAPPILLRVTPDPIGKGTLSDQ
jgi:hypothetical protein